MKSVYARWRERKTYASYESMPNWLVIIFGGASFVVSGYFGLVFSASMPKYLGKTGQANLFEVFSTLD